MADTPPKTEQRDHSSHFSVLPCLLLCSRAVLDQPLQYNILLARLRERYMAPTLLYQPCFSSKEETKRYETRQQKLGRPVCVYDAFKKKTCWGVLVHCFFPLSRFSSSRPPSPPYMCCGALFLISFRLFPSPFSPQTLTHTHRPTLLSHTHSTTHTHTTRTHTHRTNKQKEGVGGRVQNDEVCG